MSVLAGLLLVAVFLLATAVLALALAVAWLLRRRRPHPTPSPPGPPPTIPDHFDEPGLATTLAGRLAGPPASGAPPPAPAAAAPTSVVWVDAGDEVLVHLDSVRTRILDGALVVSVDLETDQTGRAPLVVAISLGGEGDQAGLVGVTDELPRGSPLLAARWGRPLQEAVWSGLLGLAADHALERDLAPRGIAVVPGRLTLAPGGRLTAP